MKFIQIAAFVVLACGLATPGVQAQVQSTKTKRVIQTPMVSPGRESRPVANDERIRMINYNPNEVVQLRGAYGFSMTVEFAEDETIGTVSIGDSIAWQIIPKRNMLFLKPQEEKPETNLLVMTNKRNYTFSLLGFRPNGVGDPRLTYRVKFRYPDEEDQAVARTTGGMALTRELSSLGAPPSDESAKGLRLPPSRERGYAPTEWNFNYSFKGSKLAAPVQMLDDGQFTYVRFADIQNTPAIFHVDSEKKETLINFRREGKWLVIERIGRQFLFRANNNTDVTCVFNDGYPERPLSSIREREGS